MGMDIIAFGLHTMMGMDMANLPSIYKAASHSNVASVSVCPAKDDCTQQTPSDKAVLFLLFTPPMPHVAMTPDSCFLTMMSQTYQSSIQKRNK